MARTSHDHHTPDQSAFFAERRRPEPANEYLAKMPPASARGAVGQRVRAVVQAMESKKEKRRYDEELRRGVRAALDVSAQCVVGGQMHEAYLKDLSSSGMQLVIAAPIPVGVSITVTFDMAAVVKTKRRDLRFTLNGRVVRYIRKPTGHEHGIRFIAAPEIAAQLRDLVLAMKLQNSPKPSGAFAVAWSAMR